MPRDARCAFHDCARRGRYGLTLGWGRDVRLWLWLCAEHLAVITEDTEAEDEPAPGR